ncbi:MAG TPA: anti-sigma factor [Rhodoferax sp.]|nr:anti-sigma factor [Rhodoferax sp.]
MTDTTSSPNPAPTPPCHVTRWRVATIICLILLAIAAATGVSMMEQFKAQLIHLQTKLKSVPQVKYVAVLLDDKHLPAQLITFDPLDGYLLIQRLNDVKEGQEDSMQLWALDEQDQPLSLGVLTTKIKTAQIPVTDKILSQARGLAISVEKKGGVEAGSPPRLPYLFTGVLIRKTL